ncbi:response regulator transcription factor [Acetobacter sp.]|uniref:response regulator transcription factor n=1 Tax=Acetobacter sp. TaxID=440 RepID=UPI0039E852F5
MTDDCVVYVIDDDSSVRAALEDLLASVGIRVLAFDTTTAFLTHGMEDVPGCLVLDVRMPGQSGIDFHRSMAGLGINLPVIFITGHGDIPMGVDAIKHGAIEFLTKPFNDQTLLDAIQNGISMDQERRRTEAEGLALHTLWSSLSAGEQDVARLVVRGLLNKQIAAELNVSEITVKIRRAQVMRKMDAQTLPDLVRLTEKLALSS